MRTKCPNDHCSINGFTFIEMIVVIVVVAILGITMAPFIRSSVGGLVDLNEDREFLQVSRIGYKMLCKELDRIPTPWSITSGQATSITFDLSDESDIDYDFNAGLLRRENVTLLENIQSGQFSFFSKDGTQIPTPFQEDSTVWRIQINLLVSDGERSFTFNNQVNPRSFHYVQTQ
ncbi:hypothetical protein BVY01_03040 [bacterium I07]|nr:hypothetical protein BVY01_03040 [bacterium I07]